MGRILWYAPVTRQRLCNKQAFIWLPSLGSDSVNMQVSVAARGYSNEECCFLCILCYYKQEELSPENECVEGESLHDMVQKRHSSFCGWGIRTAQELRGGQCGLLEPLPRTAQELREGQCPLLEPLPRTARELREEHCPLLEPLPRNAVMTDWHR
jgi:hypothetical protein